MKSRAHIFVGATLLLYSMLTMAQQIQTEQDGVVPRQIMRSLGVDADVQELTNGYGNWYSSTLRGVYGTGDHVWQGELSKKERYNENGAFLGLGDTYTISPEWFTALSVGAGDGAFYLPTFRADASLNRKLLTRQNLVGSLGLGYYNAPDDHTDQYLSLGTVYYFESLWIVEGGIRFNDSDPGSVFTHQQYAAATYGYGQNDTFIGRVGWGEEGYLAISADTSLVNFDSHEASLTWRHTIDKQLGFSLSADYYNNPSYTRRGVNIGVLYQF